LQGSRGRIDHNRVRQEAGRRSIPPNVIGETKKKTTGPMRPGTPEAGPRGKVTGA